jgi:hypothetical protein
MLLALQKQHPSLDHQLEREMKRFGPAVVEEDRA